MWTVLMDCRSSAELEGSTSPSSRGCGLEFIANLTDMHKPCFCPGCRKELFAARQYGEMLPLSERRKSEPTLISFMAGSHNHARISVVREMEQAWKESEAACFLKLSAWLANFDRDSFSWKTCQLSLFEGLTEFSWSSLRWGTIVDGRLYQPQRWEPRISESAGSFLPTPTAQDYGTNQSIGSGATVGPSLSQMARKNLLLTPRANDREKRGDFDAMNPRNGLPAAVKRLPTPRASDAGKSGNDTETLVGAVRQQYPSPQARDWKDGLTPKKHGRHSPSVAVATDGHPGFLNPAFVEAMMGYRIGWTVLEDWVIPFARNRRKKPLKD